MIPQTIVKFLGQSFGLLDAALQDPALLGCLLARMGYRVTLAGDDLPAVAGVLDIATELSTVIDNLDDLGNVSTAGDAAFEIVQASRDIVIALDGLANLSANDLAGLPAPLDTPDFWQDAATALLEQLLLETLETAYPRVATALALLGLINTQDIEIQGLTVSRTRFFWENLGPLLQDPPGYLAGIYGWGSEFNHGALLALLGVLLGHAGLQPTFGPIREHLAATFFGGDVPAAARELALILFSGFLRLEDGTTARTRQGMLLMPVPERPGGAISGLYLANLSEGEAVTRIELGATLVAEIAGSADASGAVGIVSMGFAGTAAIAFLRERLIRMWMRRDPFPRAYPSARVAMPKSHEDFTISFAPATGTISPVAPPPAVIRSGFVSSTTLSTPSIRTVRESFRYSISPTVPRVTGS